LIQLFHDGVGVKTLAKKFKKRSKDINRIIRSLHAIKKIPGRKVTEPNMEEQLLDWIAQIRATEEWSKLKNRGAAIQKKARELSEKDNFSASKGWLYAFLKRHHIGLGKKSQVI